MAISYEEPAVKSAAISATISTITIKDGGRHPPYQSKKAAPNEIPENDS
jgi:hypothetical protein